MKTFTDVDNLIVYLKKKLDVEVGKKDDLISISFDSAYPEEAAQIVNATVDSYVSDRSMHQRASAADVLKLLQKGKATSDTELTDKLQAMLEFKKKEGTISFDTDKGNIVFQRLAKLSDALTSAQLDTIDVRAAYQAAQAMTDDPAKIKHLVEAQRGKGVYISFNREEAEIRADLNQLQVQLVALRQEGTSEHPRVQTLENQIAQLQEQLASRDRRFAEAYLAAIRQQWETAKNKQQELEATLDQQQELAQELNVKSAEYAVLESQSKRAEKLCDVLDSRIKEINVTEETGALNISILEVAKPEDKPTKPNRKRIMAMALVLGLMLGGGLALSRDWMDQRLRSVEEISATVGAAVLGVVPHMVKRHSTPAQRGQQVQLEPQSAAAEAYRTVRTAVYFGVPDGEAKTLLITSPAPGDGKTTMVSNLAIAMAQAGQRTLVLDGDFRNPMQHKIFEVQQDGGLSNILAGRGQLSEFIQRTKVEGLDVLPCGPIPPNPSEMLNSKAFAKLLEELSTRYDHILIDSPPVMPVTDARILGAMSDVTLLVLRAEKSTRKAAEQSREGLLSVGAHILGAVVNDVPRRGRGGYGYYGYYRSYYPYRYGRKDRQKESPAEAAVS